MSCRCGAECEGGPTRTRAACQTCGQMGLPCVEWNSRASDGARYQCGACRGVPLTVGAELVVPIPERTVRQLAMLEGY